MDALLNRAELLLCNCRKELFYGKLEELKKNCVREQNDVLRMEGNPFSKLWRDYEERLSEEKDEMVRAELELKLAEEEFTELERCISAMKDVSSIYNVEELSDIEKELHDWCEVMEKGWTAFSFLHRWMTEAEAERLRVYSNPADVKKNKQLHDELDLFFCKLENFLSCVGRVRYLPGIRIKNGFRTNRTTLMGGKTFMFLRKGYGAFQLDLHEFYLREMESGWATGGALERKLKELEHMEQLCRSIIIEKLPLGEELLRKVRIYCYQPTEKDIFGFEIKENERY